VIVSNPHDRGLLAELVEIHPRHRLAEAFRDAVKPIRPQWVGWRQPRGLRIEAGNVVGTGKEDARLALRPRRLVEVVDPCDIGVQDRREAFLCRHAAQMQDGVATLDQPHHGAGVAQIAAHQLFVRRGLTQIADVGQAHHIGHCGKPGADGAAKHTGRTGEQKAFHIGPQFIKLDRNIEIAGI
jgi:hypothetical protein